MNITQQLKELFTSPRFISFYWSFGAMAVPALFDIVLQSISTLDIPTQVVVILGLVFAQITKALNNKANNKPMGFKK